MSHLKYFLFLLFFLSVPITAQTKIINVDSKANCFLIPDSNVVSGLTPGLEYKVSVTANGTIFAPMQGVFFMYVDVNSQPNYYILNQRETEKFLIKT